MTTAAPAPSFAVFVVDADPCPAPAAPDASFNPPPADLKVTVRWKIDGHVDDVYDAVDDPDGPFNSGLPTSGSETFTRDCSGAHTYFVVAVSNGTKIVKSKVVPGT